MKKRTSIVAFAVAFLFAGMAYAVKSNAAVNFNITLPGLGITSRPSLTVIPGTYVYIAPDVGVDLFFYQGYWYRPYRGEWYVSVEYNGPWGRVAIGNVPPPLVSLPPDYRHVPPGYERMPYPTVKRNWRRWEEERHWDTHHREEEHGMGHGGHGMGRGMGMGR